MNDSKVSALERCLLHPPRRIPWLHHWARECLRWLLSQSSGFFCCRGSSGLLEMFKKLGKASTLVANFYDSLCRDYSDDDGDPSTM